MLYQFRRQFTVNRFNHRIAGVLDTPPLAMRDGPVPLTFASLMSHNDLRMYLVAIKSIYTAIGYGRIAIVSDGSLQQDDEVILRRHLPGVEIHPISGVDPSPCPRGGCWERLWFILGKTPESYVIQVDSDTVTCGAIPEVIECVERNTSFVLGTRQGRALVPVAEAAAFARQQSPGHVQIAAEQILDQAPGAAGLRYVRGSAGFSGFARHAFSHARLAEFSRWMDTQLPTRWREWGTEQLASNFVVANSPSATVIPYPRYACFDLNMDPDQSVFLHFIGTNRFDRGVYATKSRAFIAAQRAG